MLIVMALIKDNWEGGGGAEGGHIMSKCPKMP